MLIYWYIKQEKTLRVEGEQPPAVLMTYGRVLLL